MYTTSETTFSSNKVNFMIYYECNIIISFVAGLLARLQASPGQGTSGHLGCFTVGLK